MLSVDIEFTASLGYISPAGLALKLIVMCEIAGVSGVLRYGKATAFYAPRGVDTHSQLWFEYNALLTSLELQGQETRSPNAGPPRFEQALAAIEAWRE